MLPYAIAIFALLLIAVFLARRQREFVGDGETKAATATMV